MKLLHNIGIAPSRDPRIASNYHTREQVEKATEPLSFDGVYQNVFENQDILEGKDITFFVVGNTVGGDNSFDDGMPREEYCTWDEIMDMVIRLKAKIGWHTWSHPDLTTLSREEIMKEITPPFPMEDFAYPYGRFNDLVVECVKAAGYKRAWSVTQGNDNLFTLYRPYL